MIGLAPKESGSGRVSRLAEFGARLLVVNLVVSWCVIGGCGEESSRTTGSSSLVGTWILDQLEEAPHIDVEWRLDIHADGTFESHWVAGDVESRVLGRWSQDGDRFVLETHERNGTALAEPGTMFTGALPDADVLTCIGDRQERLFRRER